MILFLKQDKGLNDWIFLFLDFYENMNRARKIGMVKRVGKVTNIKLLKVKQNFYNKFSNIC